MSVELSKVKAKIMALSRMSMENGCSENEAMQAMAAIGKLLTQYNLTMSECDVRESKCVTVEVEVPSFIRAPIDTCIAALGNLFYGRCWFQRGSKGAYSIRMNDWAIKPRPAKYSFFIQQHDKEAIEYLFALIWEALDVEARAYKHSDHYRSLPRRERKGASQSFIRGMGERISVRLQTMRKENDMAMAAAKGTGTSLMVLKGQLIQEEFEKNGPKLRKAYGTRRIANWQSYANGSARGDKINLNRPLTSDDKVSGFIG